jgi:radical SAM enzyme (TIGR01210 family)
MTSLLENEGRASELMGGDRLWFDLNEQRMVRAATVYIAYGCPDWGAPNGIRKRQLCPFCILPDLAIDYQERHFGGSMSSTDHLELFEQVFAATLAGVPELHTLNVFNGGSFFQMPGPVQEGVVRRVAESGRVRRIVVESRAGLITAEALDPLLEMLGQVRLTVRIGVETKDHHLRTKRLPKGQSYSQLRAASQVMLQRKVASGGYVILNPASGLSKDQMLREARSTIEWVLESGVEGLGMQEVYFCAACVESGTRLEEEWLAGIFRPARLWDVFDVLAWAVERYGRRVHLLPFQEALPYVAVPSNHVPQGIPQNLEGAKGCDIQFHSLFQRYRETMDPGLLEPPSCSCRDRIDC